MQPDRLPLRGDDGSPVGSLHADRAELRALRAQLDRAVETRENANRVSVRVELENARLREALERLREAFDALWEVATDMRPYVPDHFAEKWDHDRDLAAAKELRDA